jgi:enamine deaminase RidA (YjgF/YER057c/UK114 family)
MEFSIIHNPPNVHKTAGYAHAVRMGDILFLSGQVAQNEQGQIVGIGNPEAQVEQIYRNLRAVLEAGGSSLERIGKMTILTTSIEYLPAIRAVRDRVFAPIGHVPASTLAIISSLAHPDYLVEIEVVAAIG